jgi:spoIIIJ-associated protein
MNQKTTLEIIAPTVEEAIARGLSELGLTADAVSVEVLDAGNKGLFGFGKTQVRVRLTVNSPGDPMDIQAESVPAPQREAERVKSRPEPVDRAPSKPARTGSAPLAREKEPAPEPEHDALLDHTESVISKLLHLLNLQAQVSAHYGPSERDGRRNIHVDIRGNDLSVLIGRRSETLSAFQYVASLIQMAKRMADQVAKSGRRQTLEPMPSGERRIIHIALRDHPNVKTESTGEEPYRKVMILPKD